MEGGEEGGRVQNVVVMRHGDRADHRGPEWIRGAGRPWDPPLHGDGRARARRAGRRFRDIGFPIHRIFVSPFLRCRETAAEVAAAICAADGTWCCGGAWTGRSKLKVSIEYGLCEVIGRSGGIDPKVAPRDRNWFPAISELESLFPTCRIDPTHEPICKWIPSWEEEQEDGWKRLAEVIQGLADKYPLENLLLVTHGQCVAVSVDAFFDGARTSAVSYCGYTHLRRPVRTDVLGRAAPAGGGERFKLYSQSGVTITRE